MHCRDNLTGRDNHNACRCARSFSLFSLFFLFSFSLNFLSLSFFLSISFLISTLPAKCHWCPPYQPVLLLRPVQLIVSSRPLKKGS